MKKTLKVLGLVLLIGLLGGFLPAVMGAYGLYWERYSSSFIANPLDPARWWYKPLERVAGNPKGDFETLPADENPFDETVIKTAVDYAGRFDSLALLVLYGGRVAVAHYWGGADADTVIAGHSMTKTVTAMLMGHAIADGFVQSVDEPAANYLPEWDTPERRAITIRDLLNMASGVQESYDFRPKSLRMQRVMGLDVVPANLAVEVTGPPGQIFAHFNPNSQLLGVIIERASGRRFGEYLSEKIWQPLQARDAELFVDSPGGTAHTDCCMWGSVGDWARIGETLRNNGQFEGRQVLPEGWVAAMLEPSAAYANYGMQIWLGREYEENRRYDPSMDTFANYHSEPFTAKDLFYLDGLGKQRVYVIPSRQLVILRVGSGDAEFDDAWLPNWFTRAVDKHTAMAKTAADAGSP